MPTRAERIRTYWKMSCLALAPLVGILAYHATEAHLGYTFIFTILTLGIIAQSLETTNG